MHFSISKSNLELSDKQSAKNEKQEKNITFCSKLAAKL